MSPIMRIKTKIMNFTVPKTLFRMMPHFREIVWSKHAKVLAANAIAMIRPGVSCACAASRRFWAMDTELAAVFSRTIKVIPNKHVARKVGFFKR
jgi:hypothetical protein